MSDNKKLKSKQDRIRVDGKDPSEVAYLRKQFPGISTRALTGAIRAAGPLRKDIIKYLQKKTETRYYNTSIGKGQVLRVTIRC
ncbi:MAG TPA: DUF3606 domain-containing protein [Ferruginibacter sp.]|nr:DUF3606 domain-containing protein [Ferruginibacter sp.]